MLALTNLPAMLLVLNIAAAPPDGSAQDQPNVQAEAQATNVGFARLQINRDVRFVIHDESASRKIESLRRAGKPDNAGGLPRLPGRDPGRKLIRFEHLIKPAG